MQKFGVARTTPVWPCGGFGHPQKAKRRKKNGGLASWGWFRPPSFCKLGVAKPPPRPTPWLAIGGGSSHPLVKMGGGGQPPPMAKMG
jgi:hypothetical protein